MALLVKGGEEKHRGRCKAGIIGLGVYEVPLLL